MLLSLRGAGLAARSVDLVELASVAEGTKGRTSESLQIRGLERMIAWSNFAVPALTPEPVPYRGLSNLGAELLSIARIAGLEGEFSLKGRDDLLEAGFVTAPAGMYGFTVNDETSVEFGLLPDAWSRAGPLACVVIGLIAGFCFIAIERWLILRVVRAADSSLLLYCVAAKCILDGYTSPFQFMARHLVLDLLFVVILSSAVRFV